jgi:hypothetical protein
MELDDLNVTEKIMAELTSHERKRPRGYPEQIDEGRLFGVRQHLHGLMETTWDEVGSVLPSVRTMAHLRQALKPWEKRVEQEEHVVKALLRSTERPATSNLLYRQRKDMGEVHERYLSAYDWIGKCWDSLQRFMLIDAADLSPAEQDVIRDAIYERTRTLARAGQECMALSDQEKELEALVRDGEAYFARVEFLRFCLSERYRLTPLNVANAIAGLPFIGCRHSAKRCRKWPEISGGLSYEIFRILRRIVEANVRRSELVRDAEKWLRQRHSKKAFAVSDLRENWYYLRWSISAMVKQGMRRAQMPSAISREYWRRKSNPTAVDRAFAEEERIII